MLLRLFAFIILGYLLYRAIQELHRLTTSRKSKDNQFKNKLPDGEDLVEDPVCRTYVPLSQAYKKRISGKEMYFCSKQCSDKYCKENNI